MTLRYTVVLALAGCGGIDSYGGLSGPPGAPAPDPGDEDPLDPASSSSDDGTSEPTLETTAAECVWTDVAPPADAATGLPMSPPVWLGVSFVGIVEDGRVRDYHVDGVGYSALLVFDFFTSDLQWQCQIVYDASTATPVVAPWPTTSGDPLWAAFEVPLAASASTCGTVNGQDARALVERFTWGVGFGPLDSLRQPLQDSVTADGGDWAGDWEPYTFATYVRADLFDATGAAVETSYATSFDKDCDEVVVDADAVPYALPAPTGATPLADFVSSSPMLVIAL